MELLSKITPSNIAGFLGNRSQIRRLQEILKCPNYTTITYIIGPDGCGKSTLVKLLTAVDFHVFFLQPDTLKEMNTVINNIICNKTIDCFFIKKPKVIIIDNFDVLLATEKGVLSALNGFSPHFDKQRIICIACTNISQEKKLSEIKRNIEIVKLSYPQQNDALAFLLSQIPDADSAKLLKLVQRYRGSIRDIVMNYNTPFDEVAVNLKDFTSFEVISHIFRNGMAIENVERITKEDVGLVSFLLYENFPDELLAHKDIGRKKHALISQVLEVNAAFLATTIFEYMVDSWDLINILRVISIAQALKKLASKKQPKEYKYKFCQTLSKISHKNIMNKKLRTIQSERHLTQENLLVFADIAASSTNADENVFIQTYRKYFA